MAATVRASWFGGAGSEPAGDSVESGFTLSRSDAKAPGSGTSPVPVPSSAGTNYSWIQLWALEVTGTDSTSISNRTIRLASSLATGLYLWFKQQTTYQQPASGNKPTDSGSDAATPAGYTLLTTSPQTYDSGSDSAGSTGRSGDFAEVVGGVDSSYTGGAGQGSYPDVIIGYDES